MNRGAAVFFLSDFGLTDEFVGVVHAVLQRFAPGTPVIDLTHAISPFGIAEGAACLERSVDACRRERRAAKQALRPVQIALMAGSPVVWHQGHGGGG